VVTFGENEREIRYEIDEAGGLIYPESAANTSQREVMYLALRVFRATPCLKPLLDAERLGTAKWEEIVMSEAQRAKISKKLDQMAFTREDLDAPYSQPVLHQLQYWVDFFAIKASTQPSSNFRNYDGHSTNVLGMLRYQAHHHSPTKVVGFQDFSPDGIMKRALGLALASSRRKSITLPSVSPTVIISTASPSDSEPARRRPRPAIPLGEGEEYLSETSMFNVVKSRAWYNSRPSVIAARKKQQEESSSPARPQGSSTGTKAKAAGGKDKETGGKGKGADAVGKEGNKRKGTPVDGRVSTKAKAAGGKDKETGGKGKGADAVGKEGNKRKATPVDGGVSKRRKLEKLLEEDEIRERKLTCICSAGCTSLMSTNSSSQKDEASLSV
jgi:hypothetical protein